MNIITGHTAQPSSIMKGKGSFHLSKSSPFSPFLRLYGNHFSFSVGWVMDFSTKISRMG